MYKVDRTYPNFIGGDWVSYRSGRAFDFAEQEMNLAEQDR